MNLSKEIEIILGNLFRENRVAFFCGAGLSFNSGIPVVSAITLEILSTLLQDENEAKDLRALLELSKRPFEAFMQTVINLSGDDQLLDVFKLGRPNANHILIALLCKSKTIDEVFTTNFDLLIEEALRDVGLEEGKDFLVFSSEKEFKKGLSLIKKKDSRIKIFKIHGSIHNKATIRTTLESIGRKEWLMQRLKVIQYAFCFQHNTTLLIEGYSFSDFFDTNSVLKSLTNKKDIFCVHHCSDQTEGVLIDLRAEKLNNNISNWDVGSKVIANTGQITELLWRMNNFYPIDNNEFYKQIEINWKDEIYAWKCRLNPSLKEYLLAQLYFDSANLDKALMWNAKALKIASKHHLVRNKLNILYQRAAFRHRKGDISIVRKVSNALFEESSSVKHKPTIASSINMQGLILLHNEGNYLGAKERFELSLPIFRSIQDKKGEAITLLNLGSCFRHLGDYSSAIELHKQSIEIRKEIGDFQGLGRCYQGLGNVYFCQDLITDATKHYKSFLKMAELIGDEWEIATAKYKLAGCYLYSSNRKKLKEALSLCKSSLEIREKNKNREYANCLFLRAQLNFKLKHISDYSKDLEDARIIRKELKHKEDIAEVLFERGNMMNFVRKDINKSFQNYMGALKIYLNIKDNKQLAKVIDSINQISNQLSPRQISRFNNILSDWNKD